MKDLFNFRLIFIPYFDFYQSRGYVNNDFMLDNITYNKTFFVSRYKVFTKNIAN